VTRRVLFLLAVLSAGFALAACQGPRVPPEDEARPEPPGTAVLRSFAAAPSSGARAGHSP
jgi:hypothetical protein